MIYTVKFDDGKETTINTEEESLSEALDRFRSMGHEFEVIPAEKEDIDGK